jgi:DNA-binding NarL/FixJ family response regulator
MKILLVEDDPIKAAQVLSFLSEIVPGSEIVLRRSYSSGLREIRANQPDIVLLDMSLPNFDPDLEEDSGKFRSYGGRDVMHQVKRRRLSVKMIVVTQFETFSTGKETVQLSDLSGELQKEFPEIFLGTVYYNASEDSWKKQLSDLIGRNCGA